MNISRAEIARYLIDSPDQMSVKRVAAYLLQSGRQKEFDVVLRATQEQLSAQGHEVARVTTAHMLTPSLEAQVRAAVVKVTGAKTVEIITTIDPDLVGGVVIQTSQYEMNLSVQHKLHQLKHYDQKTSVKGE